jgi:hypothetical protein
VNEPLIRKPGPIVEPGLGQRFRIVKGQRVRDADRGLTRTELAKQLRHVPHATCVEHVALTGLRSPVCIRRGEDRESVLAAARELTETGTR